MRLCIFADDLTGANGVASLLKREGLPSHTHLFSPGGAPAALARDGAHVLDLETRDRPDAEAVTRLAIASGWIGAPPDLLGLRIDSTLRGPIAASIDALLAHAERLALVVPAFPASGRTTRGGIHYVHGTPLAETEVADDPHCPVTDSRVAAWLGSRMHSAHATLDLGVVRAGPEAVAAAMVRCARAGARVVFCDAETDHDIAAIARGALTLRYDRGLEILPVDPGPFTASIAGIMREPRAVSPLVFGIIGSVMDTSRQQMDFVTSGGYAHVLSYAGQSPGALLAAFEQAAVATKAVLLRTDAAPLDAVSQARLHATLTEVLGQAVARFPSLRGFLMSGGETAGRLLNDAGVRSLCMQSEIMPLIALSRIVDGTLSGRFLVTKGGTVGPVSAIADALGRLYDAIADAASGD